MRFNNANRDQIHYTLNDLNNENDRLYPYTLIEKLRNEDTSLERLQPGYIRNFPNFTWLSERYNADDYEFANETEQWLIEYTNKV